MNLSLKLLYIQSEIRRIKSRIDQYKDTYDSLEIKDINLRRLIVIKQREKDILETMLRGLTNDE